VSIFVLSLLAIAAFVLAFAPRWRGRFRWGRAADSYRATRFGCLFLAAALAMMAGGLAAQHLRLVKEPVGFFVLLAGFVLCVAAGLLDRPKR
jgi:hypothetical protein